MHKILIQLLYWFLPWRLRRYLLIKTFGYELSETCKIGFGIILADEVELGPSSWVGHLTFVKNLGLLKLGNHSRLGNLNWVTGYPKSGTSHFTHVTARNPALIIGDHSAITNRHILDCTDEISIGRFTTIGGFRGQILTHSIDPQESRQNCMPVRVGDFCFVGTGFLILGGASIGDRVVVAAGAVVADHLTESDTLYGGVPAKAIKRLHDAKYFKRTTGFVN